MKKTEQNTEISLVTLIEVFKKSSLRFVKYFVFEKLLIIYVVIHTI